jgi:hypothetical protein
MGLVRARGGDDAQRSLPRSGARDHPADAFGVAYRGGDLVFEIYDVSPDQRVV